MQFHLSSRLSRAFIRYSRDAAIARPRFGTGGAFADAEWPIGGGRVWAEGPKGRGMKQPGTIVSGKKSAARRCQIEFRRGEHRERDENRAVCRVFGKKRRVKGGAGSRRGSREREGGEDGRSTGQDKGVTSEFRE